MTAAATCAVGEVWTASAYIKASAAGVAQFATGVRYFEADGTTPVGNDQYSTLTPVTTSWQRVTVTTAAAGANTSRARIALDFQNAAATAVDIYIRNAQFEKASAATPFRVGTQTVNNDPVLTQGRVMPIWEEGNAPTPADLYVRDGSNGWRKAWAAIKSRPQVGDRGLVEYVNAHHLSAEGGTMGTDTATFLISLEYIETSDDGNTRLQR